MHIKLITKPITRQEALEIGQAFSSEMVKGVVDIKKEIIALGGEYHTDANKIILRDGSLQSDVWGFNLYPDRFREDWIEYTSLINIRPAAHNRMMTVEDEHIRQKMKKIIETLIL